MLTGNLATLVVKGVPVAVSRRVAEGADVTIFFEPAQLDIWMK